MRRVFFGLALLLSFSVSVSAQVGSSGASIKRDPKAVSTVQAAINALGGSAAIAQAQTWQIQGQTQDTMPDGTTASGTFTWETNGTDFRMAYTMGQTSGYMVTGQGNPAYVTTGSNGTAVAAPQFVVAATFIPALVAPLLSQQLANAECPLVYDGSIKLGSEVVTVVKTRLMSSWKASVRVTEQTWYFDTMTNLPVKIDFLLPSQISPLVSIQASIALSNYQQVSGVLYPFQVTRSYRKQVASVATIQSVSVNPTILASDFDAPLGGAQ